MVGYQNQFQLNIKFPKQTRTFTSFGLDVYFENFMKAQAPFYLSFTRMSLKKDDNKHIFQRIGRCQAIQAKGCPY